MNAAPTPRASNLSPLNSGAPEISLPPSMAAEHAQDAISYLRNVRIIRSCAIALTVIAILAASAAASALIAPTAIAVVLALILAPAVHQLERLRLHAGIASFLVVVATVSCLVGGAFSIAPSAADWANRAPQIMRTLEQKLKPIKKQLAVVEDASRRIAGSPGNSTPAANPAPSPTGMLVSAVQGAPVVIAECIYVTILTIFLLTCRRAYSQQLVLLPKTLGGRIRMARIIRDVRTRVGGYFLTLAAINVGLTICTFATFQLAGIPEPLIWAVAFGVCNFVPIIGPTTVIIACTLVSFAIQPNFAQALIAPGILLVLNTIEANLVQPWLLSRRLVLSPIAIFVMVAMLVWMWGAPAAITAVPTLIFVHAVMQHVPALQRFSTLLASTGTHKHVRNRDSTVADTCPAGVTPKASG